MKLGYLLMAALVVTGCAKMPLGFGKDRPVSGAEVAAAQPSEDQLRPKARPTGLSNRAPAPPSGARTVEQFDTTSAADRAKAAAAPAEPAAEQALGRTIASLGDVAKPGFWLETPLVTSATKGRVFYPASGKSAQVDLLPIDGPATAGSRISLAAMRLIEAPLTELPEIEVFSGGAS